MRRKRIVNETQSTVIQAVRESFMLGMGLYFISRALSISLQEVKQYIAVVRNTTDRPIRADERFQKILLRFAQLTIENLTASCDDILKGICGDWLKIPSLQNRVQELDNTIDKLTISLYPSDAIPYVNLFWIILRGKKEDFQSRWADFLLRYSVQITQNEIIVPTQRKAWEDEIYNRYLEDQWYRLVHLLPEEIKRKLKEVMKGLNPQQKEAIYYRFGLQSTKITLAQAGEKMDLSREGVRQKEIEALEFLRHPSVIRQLQELTDYFPWTLERYLNKLKEHEKYIAYLGKTLSILTEENKRLRTQLKKEQNRIISDKGILTQLVRPISEVRFPKRAERYFREQKIYFIGELAQRTNQEILDARSLGTKSLKEIRAILQDLGLDTGIRLSPELKEELEKLIHPKRKHG